MSIIDNELKRVWDQLRGDKPHRQTFLEEITIRSMRGITNLRVPLEFPVTVLAGENACGKSTVLFGCACAYKVPGASNKEYVPTTLFPNFTIGKMDSMDKTELEYAYIDNGRRMNMVWRRGKAWNRSFFGRKGATQPERKVYLRTLANLTNPSEVRSMLQIKRRDPIIDDVNPGLLALAKRTLPFDYQNVQQAKKSHGRGDLLLAELKNSSAYSEFHMASGERSILRMSIEISSNLFIGKNTGKHEFPAHVRALARIQQLQDFIFVLDGDGRDMIRPIEQAADADNAKVQLLFLPGEFCPEQWLWDTIGRDTATYGELLAIGQTQLEKAMQEAQAIMAGTTAAESEHQKEQLRFLANQLQKEVTDVARLVARQNTKDGGEIAEFVNDLEDKISDWRTQ